MTSFNFKPDSGSKYLQSAGKSIISHSKKHSKDDLFIDKSSALLCLGDYRLKVKSQFYETNQRFLSCAIKQINQIKAHREQLEGIFLSEDQAIYPLADFLDQSENSIIPLICIPIADFEVSKQLSGLRELIILLRKHAEDLPSGEEDLEKAENDFENLCKQHKVGRRTRKIIQNNEIKI